MGGHIREILANTIINYSNWFKKRRDVEPCNNCVFCDLCPSIGNYEYNFGKYNLCKIYENK